MFKKAIVRKPCKNLVNGLTTANLGKPNYQLAMMQHQAYIEALKECALEVTVLEADEKHPDSTLSKILPYLLLIVLLSLIQVLILVMAK